VRASLRKLRWRSLWNALGWKKEPSYERLLADAAGVEERRLIAEVYRALDRVSPKDRVAWVLRHVQRQSVEQTALSCGCSLAIAQRRIAAAHAVVSAQLDASRRTFSLRAR
jgi:DNA-directed RNA polymerase specialized sigma24 family protein